MKYRKIKRMAVFSLFLAFICCLSGCGLSFCGFPVGGREELAFACSEELPKENTGQAESGFGGADGLASTSGSDEEAGQAKSAAGAAAPDIISDGKVNINTAGVEELMTLKGVGETRAKAIIEYRETYGPFQCKEDIMLIPGIKEGIFSKIEEQIAVQ